MGKLKIERLAQNLHESNKSPYRVVFDKAQKDFANWCYLMAMRGRLYCTTENGDMRKVEIKE